MKPFASLMMGRRILTTFCCVMLPLSLLRAQDGKGSSTGTGWIPHVELTGTFPVKPNTTFQVTVSAERPKNDNSGGQINLGPSDQDSREFQTVVYLIPSQQLHVIKGEQKTIVIRPNETTSQTAVFRVRAEPEQDGNPGMITALFFYDGYPCGRVRQEIPIDLSGEPDSVGSEANQAGLSKPRIEPTSFPLTTGSPDLTITVIETETDDERYSHHARYQCFIQAPNAKEPNGPIEYWRNIPRKTGSYLSTEFARFSLDTSGDQARSGLMENGRRLFNKAPDQFKNVLRQLSDDHRLPKTILLFSDEPNIPWELMIPHWADQELEPLGVMSAIGRWTSDQNEPLRYPPRQVRMGTSLVWAPVYTKRLKTSAAEAKFIKDTIGGDVISPGTFDGFEAALPNSLATVLHFICHGASHAKAGEQLIEGEPGDSEDDSISVVELTGEPRFKQFCSATRPLIFLNACEVGQTIQTLNGIGGFAPSFIQNNAGAVVAPLWSVIDQQAEQAARDFYTTLKEHPDFSFAEVVQHIRRRAYRDPAAPGIVTFAAYCFYGDPLAKPVYASAPPPLPSGSPP